jgi:hypothetical protein
MTLYNADTFGLTPIPIKWKVVRGDTATLMVEFFNSDESTYFDATTEWEYVATAFDPKTEEFYELEVQPSSPGGIVNIIATPDITENWGTGIRSSVAELSFDLQVTMPDDTVWTPIAGVITVVGDVTGGSL